MDPPPPPPTTSAPPDKHTAMIQRLSDLYHSRLQHSAARRSDPISSSPAFESIHSFLDRFSAAKTSITSALSLCRSLPPGDPSLKPSLDNISASIADLDRLLADNSYFLPSYEVRSSLSAIADLKDALDAANSDLLPRKKFSFKTLTIRSASPTPRATSASSLRCWNSRMRSVTVEAPPGSCVTSPMCKMLKRPCSLSPSPPLPQPKTTSNASPPTAAHALDRIGDLLRRGVLSDIVGIPTSKKTEAHAPAVGIPLSDLSNVCIRVMGAPQLGTALRFLKALKTCRLGSVFEETQDEEMPASSQISLFLGEDEVTVQLNFEHGLTMWLDGYVILLLRFLDHCSTMPSNQENTRLGRS